MPAGFKFKLVIKSYLPTYLFDSIKVLFKGLYANTLINHYIHNSLENALHRTH